MAKAQNSVREFATIGFLLLAVLFGMQIMVFIFGGLGQLEIADVTVNVGNESITHNVVNGVSTITTIDPSNINFVSWNASVVYNISVLGGSAVGNNILVEGTDYQIFTNNGSFGNITGGWNVTNVTYAVVQKTEVELRSEEVTNDSLNAIGNYSTQAGTQFTTLGIAITLILLVAVFIFFWVAFMSKGKKGDSGPGGFS